MANRRLNKKVALIGSAVFAVVALVFILAILTVNRSPEELIQDAQTALKAAHDATDKQVREQHYDKAERSFHKAYAQAKDDTLRQEVLFMMLDMYLETQEWPFIMTCWDEIININPNNARARYGRLRYFQILGESGVTGLWQRVCEETNEFLKIAVDTGLLMEDTAQWDVPGIERKVIRRQYLGPYLYLLRGIGSLEMARSGAVTNRDEMLIQAIEDFKKAQELDPNNIDTYWHLARAAVAKGEILASRGNFEERDKSIEQAGEFLEQAVKVAVSDPRAHINLLQLNLMLARNSGSEQRKEQIRSLETDYLSLVNKFNSNAEVHAALSEYYLFYSKYSEPGLSPKNLNRAIEAIEKAMTLEEQNVVYTINTADLYYRRFLIYKQEADIQQAIEIAGRALTLPETQETTGPQNQTRIINRFQLYTLLANCYVKQILDSRAPKSASETETLLSKIENAVNEIEQILGSKEEPLAIKWRGMLELAKGDRKAAVKQLHKAYEQLKALKPSEPPWPKDLEFAHLSYTLATIFKNTPEIGAVNEFMISALHSGITDIRPEARLDYVEVALELNPWMEIIKHINAFEEYLGITQRSRNLRIKTYIRAMQFEDAEKELAKMPDQNADALKLRLSVIQARIQHAQLAIAQKHKKERMILQGSDSDSQDFTHIQTGTGQYTTEQLDGYKQLEAELSWKLLATEPNAIGQNTFINICRTYIVKGQTSQAGNFVEQYLTRFPDNVAALVYGQILLEPKPGEVSPQRYREIEEQMLLSLRDPIKKALQLGIFYHRNNELEKATEQLSNAINKGTSVEHTPEDVVYEQIKLAAEYLFDIALASNNFKLAQQIVNTAREEDLDDCQGMFFESRLAAVKGELENALAKVDECLIRKPVFSQAYFLRSNINASLGNEPASREDIRKAASLNPRDRLIAKKAATALYQRNLNLGDNILPNQVTEARKALERAIGLNLGDLELLNMYAEFIVLEEPLRAVAIRQDVLEAAPSVENAILLGTLATGVALKQIDTESKKALFDIAGSAFEQARGINPKDKRMLYYYSEYYRARGMENEASKLLAESQDEQLLWNHYLQLGRYEDAGRILEQAYQNDPKNVATLRSLMQVAEKTADRESVKKYSQELVMLEDTIDNNLALIQTFLRTSLVNEADQKLQSVKEKYPNEPRIMLLQAWLLLKKGQLEKALELTNKNLLLDQNNAIAWRLRGEINIQMAEYDNAISDLRQSKLLSDDPVIRVSLARAYMNARRFEDAVTELKNTITVPTAPQEARLLLEHIYTQLDRKEDLIEFYDKTLEKFPENTDWLNRAGAFALKTGQYGKAEQLYQKACQIRRHGSVSQNPEELIKDLSYATAFDGYLKALLMEAGEPQTNNRDPGKANQVIQECEKYLDTGFAPVAYLRMAEAYYKLGNKTNASEYCRYAIDRAGTNEALASEVLMRMFLMLGADEVSNYCRQRLETNPDSIAANFTMFNLVNTKGEYIKAIQYISKCIELTDPANPKRVDYLVKKADTLIQAFELTSDNKYLKTAISDYESLLAEMPKNINVLNNIAYILAEYNERLPEALQYAKQAMEAKPNDPGIMDTYAYVLHKNGNNPEAAEYVEAALQRYSEQNIILVPPEVYEHKGMIKEKLGNNNEALAAYRLALETGTAKLSQRVRQRINEAIKRLSP